MTSEYLALERRLSDLLVIEAIYSAIELGLIEHLAPAAMTDDRLAEATGTDPRALRHLLRLLADEGIARTVPGGCWGLTAFGQRLRPDAPESLHGMVLSYKELLHPAYRRLRFSLKTGQSGFLAAFQKGFYEHLGSDARASANFNNWMDASAADMADRLLAAYDFRSFRRFVDVGGNRGRLTAALLAAHPRMTAILFDLEQALTEAPGLLAAAGVAARCERVAGSFFEGVPGGAELYLLSRVLFNWTDERALVILQRIRAVMPVDAVLLVVDMALPDAGQASAQSATSLNLLALLGVMLRTAAEYHALLGRAGLHTRRTERIAGSELTLFEAVPAGGEQG